MSKRYQNHGEKPQKPYPEFPLYPHAAGVWAKKIRGKTVYFGAWADPNGALDNYLRQRDHLLAGQLPPPPDAITLDELVNRFLASKLNSKDIGEIGQRQYNDCKRDGRRLLEILGRNTPVSALGPDQFARLRKHLTTGRNATTVTNIIIRVRAIFRWGHVHRLLPGLPHYGDELRLPSARARRKALGDKGPRLFSAAELQTMIEAIRQPALHAMLWLGINAALGNTDCAQLRFEHLDLKAGLMVYPRPKTGIVRRALLWPETIAAVRRAIAARLRRVPDELTDLVFVTSARHAYVRITSTSQPVDSIGTPFRRALIAQSIYRPGLGFYALRHTFRTIADETRDFPAIDLVMGHSATDIAGAPHSVAMAARYRQRIGDDRLRAVAEHVRTWLLG